MNKKKSIKLNFVMNALLNMSSFIFPPEFSYSLPTIRNLFHKIASESSNSYPSGHSLIKYTYVPAL